MVAEGLYKPCIYPNGLATAFPADVQLEILQSMIVCDVFFLDVVGLGGCSYDPSWLRC